MHSFINAVQPVKGGPIYHVKCLRIKEEEKSVKKEEMAVESKPDDRYAGISFDYYDCLLNETCANKQTIVEKTVK